ncbi:MAG: dihydroneopterin aldolase [Kiritimatiellae bacterium]|nr:dihydroneopterin aldolase [Kiritimatiellia bacterium]
MIRQKGDRDRLELNGLEIDCVIGDQPEERGREQRIVLDLVLNCDLSVAGASDALCDTVDYAVLAETIRLKARAARCRMIESVAELAARVCLAEPRVTEVCVRVEKAGAVPGLGSAAVVVTRARGGGDA